MLLSQKMKEFYGEAFLYIRIEENTAPAKYKYIYIYIFGRSSILTTFKILRKKDQEKLG